jgi:hypothetical protein
VESASLAPSNAEGLPLLLQLLLLHLYLLLTLLLISLPLVKQKRGDHAPTSL